MTPEDLKVRRERLGLTQAELAKKLKVDALTVSRWERGAGKKIPYMVDLVIKQFEDEKKR